MYICVCVFLDLLVYNVCKILISLFEFFRITAGTSGKN